MGVRLPGSCESFEGGFIDRRELGNLVRSGDVFWFLVLRVKSRASGKTLRETLGGWGCLVQGPFLFMRIAVDYSLQFATGFVACRRRFGFISDAIRCYTNRFITAMQLMAAVVCVPLHVTWNEREFE
ncbi:MAG: hypothetical protein ACPGLY_21560 [Rubripirellula sp.]